MARAPKAPKPVKASPNDSVRTILKNKEAFHFDLRTSTQDGDRTTNVYDVFYGNHTGTITISFAGDQIFVAALNFNMGKILSLTNDGNMGKLAKYVLDNTH